MTDQGDEENGVPVMRKTTEQENNDNAAEAHQRDLIFGQTKPKLVIELDDYHFWHLIDKRSFPYQEIGCYETLLEAEEERTAIQERGRP